MTNKVAGARKINHCISFEVVLAIVLVIANVKKILIETAAISEKDVLPNTFNRFNNKQKNKKGVE